MASGEYKDERLLLREERLEIVQERGEKILVEKASLAMNDIPPLRDMRRYI